MLFSAMFGSKHFVTNSVRSFSVRKIPKFHLISWCRSFVEMRSFRRVTGDLLKLSGNLFVSTKFPHQGIRWNSILSVKTYCTIDTASFVKYSRNQTLSLLFNSLNASVAVTQKPVNWFSQQINWLVFIWGQHWHLMSQFNPLSF